MSEAPLEPAVPELPKRERGARRAALRKWIRRAIIVGSAVLASLLITIFSVDIGNISIGGKSIRTYAESEGSKFLKRPLHIGRIRALLTPGKFVVEDLVIEGPTTTDRPFFSAKQITVNVPWWAVLPGRRELFLDVRLSEWRMVVENWATGGARLPNLKRQGPGGPSTIKIRSLDIYAQGGEFIFDDHVSNWGVVARNLNFALVRANNLNTYVGTAEFSNGTTRIQNFLPMRTDFTTRFQMEGSKVRLHHIDLITDGARSHVNGYVNFANWPEQEYNVNSEVDFTRMREIFFAPGNWRLSGQGGFAGVFKFSKTGRVLAGQFDSDEAGLGIDNTEWRFPRLHGALEWTANHFIVSHADSEFLGGSMRLNYSLAPFGTPQGATASLTADYEDVDLYRFTRQFGFTALEPQGRMRGKVSMGWKNGKWESRQGVGETRILPPDGAPIAAATLAESAEPNPPEPESTFMKFRPFGFFALAGDTKYRFTATDLDFEPSWVATPKTYVTFSGHARGGPVNVPFHVTSHDWQNSDRLFTAIMTNFGNQVGAIEVGGRGTFDGVLTKLFNAPRIEGKFSGGQMRAWREDWGLASGDITIENGYMDLVNGVITHESGGRVFTSGRYALGYPRADGGEEIRANIHVENMPLAPLKRAFQLADWPVTGTVSSASMQLHGKYEQPSDDGKPGTMTIINGTAWDEPFEQVTSALVFEGNGSLRLRGMRMDKAGGVITGDAWVSWEENRYSFRAGTEEGGGIPVDKLTNFKVERAPLSGQLTFSASGEGSFDSPAWTMQGLIADLYAGNEGVGAVRGTLSVVNEVLKIDVDADSVNRLRVKGLGEIRLNDAYDATLTLRFSDTSLDPYLKFVYRELPYTRAIVGGSLSVAGPLADPAHLSVTATVDKANLTLFDYPLANDGDISLGLKNNVFTLDRVKFKGEGTSLELLGSVDAKVRTADMRATGNANLAVLQAFYPDLRAQGSAELLATLKGPFDTFVVDGTATIVDGRLRHPALPHGFTQINGPIVMSAGRISVDKLRAQMGEGPVTFGGDILLEGYRPSEYNLRAQGRSLALRVLPGLRTTVDADLFLKGPIKAPELSGTVFVLRAAYSPRLQNMPGYFDLLTGVAQPEAAPPPLFTLETPPVFPLTLDIRVQSNSVAFIENNAATIYGTANAYVSGTASSPIVTGSVRLDRGEWDFSGYRYRLQGGLIEFSNPLDFDPFFDVSATTRVRTTTTGQYYDVTLRLSGTLDRLQPSISSEPWLPDFQIVSMLLGETPDVGRAELLARSAPQELQTRALRQAGVIFLTSPISATVGGVAERLTSIDTVQIVPSLGGAADLQQLTPTMRLTLGKKLSERFYLTYSRNLSGSSQTQNEIILIEFDQNDQVSWILSRNEDRSFALDFRIKHVFR